MTDTNQLIITQALKPCPFCGAPGIDVGDHRASKIMCADCEACTGPWWGSKDGDIAGARAKAREVWNTRSGGQRLEGVALRERIEWATGQIHDATEWPNEDAPDGGGSLLDWVCHAPSTPVGGLEGVGEGLVKVAQAVIDGMSPTYTARNGRQVGIEATDGEKCWIVHSDDIEELRRVLSAAEPAAPAMEICPACTGAGGDNATYVCPVCNGSGGVPNLPSGASEELVERQVSCKPITDLEIAERALKAEIGSNNDFIDGVAVADLARAALAALSTPEASEEMATALADARADYLAAHKRKGELLLENVSLRAEASDTKGLVDALVDALPSLEWHSKIAADSDLRSILKRKAKRARAALAQHRDAK